ncbi:hypothetical protein B8W90_11245, partial [Staphylococcus hominis]
DGDLPPQPSAVLPRPICADGWPRTAFYSKALRARALKSQSLKSQSLGLRASLAWAGGHGGTGGAVNPSMGALAKHPCFAKPPYPRPRRPSTVCWGPREDQRQCRSFSCVNGRGGVPCRRLGTDATAPSSIHVPAA